MAAVLLRQLDGYLSQIDAVMNSNEIHVSRWTAYPAPILRLIHRFDEEMPFIASEKLHIDLSNGKPFYYNNDDQRLIAIIIKFMSNKIIPEDVIKLIFIFLKTNYKSHLSSYMKAPLLTLSNNNTEITAYCNEDGICRFEYPLPKNDISTWYILIDHNNDTMDGANTFGVISNYDTSMTSPDNQPLFPWDYDEPTPNTFYGLDGIGGIDYVERSNKNDWIQKDYNHRTVISQLKFKVVCDLRLNRNCLTIYDMKAKHKIGYKDLDYTIKLPMDNKNKKYVWYPCCCPWGPIIMTIAFDQ